MSSILKSIKRENRKANRIKKIRPEVVKKKQKTIRKKENDYDPN